MKIIIDTDLKTDNITAITASSEDANFPVENLQNDFTTDLWKATAGVLTATLLLSVSKGKAVELLNTNAISATVTVGMGGGDYDFEAGYVAESGYVLEANVPISTIVSILPGAAGRLWADYPEYTTPHVVTIVLTALATVMAGIVRAGNVETFRDPAYNNSEVSDDYSIEKELNNGADYFRKRNVTRRFGSLSIMETRANAWKFKHSIFDAVGPKPLAIRLIEEGNITDDEFVLFAKRGSSPQVSHFSGTHSRIDFDLKEVI
jgi:hypothetical protein